jgi:hypothetical protein
MFHSIHPFKWAWVTDVTAETSAGESFAVRSQVINSIIILMNLTH